MQHTSCASPEAPFAMVADVGRSTLRVGITDYAFGLRPGSVRVFDAASQPTVSGAISAVALEHGLSLGVSTPLAIAVSGIPRGDTISVTNGRWRISRSGLAAMMQCEPLILNDFAANGWAISDCGEGSLDPLVGAAFTPRQAGTYCIIGVGSGLGVALVTRDAHGTVIVLPTEAGNCSFPSGLKALDPIVHAIGARHDRVTAEMVISATGLVAGYKALVVSCGARPIADDTKALIKLGLDGKDATVANVLTLFGKALWHFAGNMVLAHGAFDGVILTGSLAKALRGVLQRAEVAQAFVLPGPYQRHLSLVPRSLFTLPNAELSGAAIALRVHRSKENILLESHFENEHAAEKLL